MEALLQNLANDLDLPLEQLKITFCLLIVIPLGLVTRISPGVYVRYIISLILGLYIQYFIYQHMILHNLGQAVLVYLLVYFFQRKAYKFVILSSFGHLFVLQIRQFYNSGWSLDVSMIFMMQLCKYQAFAFNYKDGDKQQTYKLSDEQEKFKIVKLPNIIKYLSYIFFFQSAICGPHFEYKTFEDFIERKNQYKKIPFSLSAQLKWLFYSFSFMASTVFLLPKYPIELCASEKFLELSILERFVYFNISITLIRLRYMTAWSLNQSALVSSGLSYGGSQDKEKEWTYVLACDPYLELHYNPRVKTELWNASANLWLKRYIYFRIYSEQEIRQSATKANISQYLTSIVSAIWHGFYIGYYMAFLHLSFLILLTKYLYKLSDKFSEKMLNNRIYQIVRYLAGTISMNYLGVMFNCQNWEQFMYFQSGVLHSHTILFVSGVLFFQLTGFGQSKSKAKRQ